MMGVTLNTGGAMVAATTTDPITRSVYAPYGSVRAADGLTIDHGWLNQVSDGTSTDGGTGLIYLNARYYDPVLSRFLSPDPVMNPTDPRTLDPYRYADNNPVLFADAAGMDPGCAANDTYCWLHYSQSGAYGGAPSVTASPTVSPHTNEGAARNGAAPAGGSDGTGGSPGLPWGEAARDSAIGAAGWGSSYSATLGRDASQQGRLLSGGQINNLWMYRGGASTEGNWLRFTDSSLWRGLGRSKALPVLGAFLTYRANAQRNAYIEDDQTRNALTRSETGAEVAGGVAVTSAIELAGLASCGETAGAGCIAAVAVFTGVAVWGAMEGLSRWFDHLVGDTFMEPPPQPAWWVGQPGIDPVAGPVTVVIPGVNAPGPPAYPWIVTSPSAWPTLGPNGDVVSWVCRPNG